MNKSKQKWIETSGNLKKKIEIVTNKIETNKKGKKQIEREQQDRIKANNSKKV